MSTNQTNQTNPTVEEMVAKLSERRTAYHEKRTPVNRRAKAEEMLTLHVRDNLTYEAIGERYGVSRQRVYQLINSLIKK